MDTAHLSRASSEPQLELIASPWHTLIVLVIAALNAFRAAIYANQARAGLGTSRSHLYLRTIAFECAFLALVTLGVWLRGSSLQTIFGQRWRSVGQVYRDLGSGLALWFVAIVAVSILGGHNGPPDAAIAFLLPQTPAEMTLWMIVSILAGISEEAIYRGYLQKQFAALTGSRAKADRQQSGMAAGSGRFANLDGIVAGLENNFWSARRTVFAFQV
jgi:membrane protease YdiL (CAAX protease family)